MIIDFRMVVPRQEYTGKVSDEEAARSRLESTTRGYDRIYKLQPGVEEEWKGTVEGMIRNMEEGGVDKAVLQAEYSRTGDDYYALNEAVYRVAKAHPDKFPVYFMCLNPLIDENMVEVVERGVKEQGFKGVNIQAWAVRVSSTDSRFWPVYAKCQELGLIVTVHSSISFNVDRPLLRDAGADGAVDLIRGRDRVG